MVSNPIVTPPTLATVTQAQAFDEVKRMRMQESLHRLHLEQEALRIEALKAEAAITAKAKAEAENADTRSWSECERAIKQWTRERKRLSEYERGDADIQLKAARGRLAEIAFAVVATGYLS